MKLGKKWIAGALVAALLPALGGCSLAGLDAQGLIVPPKANADQQAVHALMRGEEADIKFIYPKSGEYRSAVIMQDFTGDGVVDALGFSTEPDGGVSLRFMQKQEETWRLIATVSNMATQVDKVCFGDLDGDAVKEMVVGWGAPQSMTATIGIYNYEGEKIQETQLDHSYNELSITDFDGDNVQELFTATIFTKTEEREGDDKPAQGRVFTFSEGFPQLAYTCALNDSVVRYSSLLFGGIDKQKRGVVLDGIMADNSAVTQIVYMDGDTLVAPLSGKALQKKYNYFYRPSNLQLTSRDMDGDQFVDLPWVTLQPGYRAEGLLDSACYYVDWVGFNTVQHIHRPVARTIVNMQENYAVTLTPPYGDTVGSFYSGARSLSFRSLTLGKTGEVRDTQKFLTIRAFTAEEWETDRDGYSLLLRTGSNVIYGKQIFSDLETATAVLAGFKLIAE